jgi:glycosyltransferase involved in cell wall biosynthesis
VILFGAVNPLSDPNKGWALLQPALRRVARQHPDALAVIFGTESPAALPEPGMETRFLGRLRDDVALTAAYAAADLLVVPSRQESFCQTAVEAMACATPVAAFAATGLLDLVEHGRTGYLARPFEVDDLADGIIWLLADRARHVALAGRARQKVETEFALDRVAARYLALYHELAAIG